MKLRILQARQRLETAMEISIPRSTFYHWIESGLVPATKIVGRFYIDSQALTELVAKWQGRKTA
jgi:hypothetical protein